MKKPVIAIDCDDVVVSTAEAMLKYYNETYGTDIPLSDFYSRDYKNVWGAPDSDTAIRRINAYLETPEYISSPPLQGAIEAIEQLKERYELHIVTGRPDFMEEATKAWLAKHFPDVFKLVVFTNFFKLSDGENNSRTKADVCLELGASYLVDDHLFHAEGVAAVGIEVALFGDYPWNEADELPDGITRCKDWPAVLEYFNGRS